MCPPFVDVHNKNQSEQFNPPNRTNTSFASNTRRLFRASNLTLPNTVPFTTRSVSSLNVVTSLFQLVFEYLTQGPLSIALHSERNAPKEFLDATETTSLMASGGAIRACIRTCNTYILEIKLTDCAGWMQSTHSSVFFSVQFLSNSFHNF